MKIKQLALAAVLSFATTASAQAAVVAGWDFSQYTSSGGVLSLDGSFTNFVNTLDANYSNAPFETGDQVFGPNAAQYGVMYINGSFGSSFVDPEFAVDDGFLPVNIDLSGNINGIQPNPFSSFTLLDSAGQLESNIMSMLTGRAVNVVFKADVNGEGSGWSVSFGSAMAQGFTGGQIVVAVSTDGTAYADVQTINVAGDVGTTVNLANVPTTSEVWVQLRFSSVGILFDNVAISAANVTVPEPATAGLLALGFGGLAFLGRRRR